MHRKELKVINQIFTRAQRKSHILLHNFQNNLLLACIFCKFLNIRIRKNKHGYFSLLPSKISLPHQHLFFENGNGKSQHPQTTWVSGLRHHNERAIFSQGAGPWPSQWKMDSIKAGKPARAGVWSGGVHLFEKQGRFLYIWLVCVKTCLTSKIS